MNTKKTKKKKKNVFLENNLIHATNKILLSGLPFTELLKNSLARDYLLCCNHESSIDDFSALKND